MALISVVKAIYTRPANTTAYAAGEAVSDSATTPKALEFVLGGSGGLYNTRPIWIASASITDSIVATTAGQFRLWLFTGPLVVPDSGAAFDDNAALAIPDNYVDGTNNKLVAVIPFDTAYSTGLAQFYPYTTPPIPIYASGSDRLWGILSLANAYQSSANSNTLTVELTLESDS